MADLSRKQNTAEEMKEQDAARASGGFLFFEKYTDDQYAYVGITHKRYWYKPDQYFFRRHRISQQTALAIMRDFYLGNNDFSDKVLREKYKVKM